MQHVSKAELDAAWKYSASFENVKHNLYLDSKGVPTIGAGYTPIIRNNATKRWELRTSVAADMKAAGVALTKPQANTLKQMETDMNAGGAKNNPKVTQGVANLQSITVDKGQARNLFEQVYDRNRGIAINSVGQQTFDSLSPERKAVLGGIAYQSPAAISKAGPELAKYLAAQDYAAAGKIIEKLGLGPGADASRYETMGTLMENPDMTDRVFVKQGDTLSAIAKIHGTTVQEILRLNNIPDPDRIRAGTILNLAPKNPGDQTAPGAGQNRDNPLSPRPEAPPALERILESPVSEWGEDDVTRVHAEATRRGAASPRGKALSGKVNEWYGHFYGNDPAPMDATGRLREPRPVRPRPAGVGMGPVYVRAHSRSQDGTAVQVDAYSRSRPRSRKAPATPGFHAGRSGFGTFFFTPPTCVRG